METRNNTPCKIVESPRSPKTLTFFYLKKKSIARMHGYLLQSPRTLLPLSWSPGWRWPTRTPVKAQRRISNWWEKPNFRNHISFITNDDSFKTICPLMISTLGPIGLVIKWTPMDQMKKYQHRSLAPFKALTHSRQQPSLLVDFGWLCVLVLTTSSVAGNPNQW